MEISLDLQLIWNEKDTVDKLEGHFNATLCASVRNMGVKKKPLSDKQ